MVLRVFTDGGARGNPGPAAAGFVVFEESGNLREKRGKPFDRLRKKFARGKYLGVATNNVAEYTAVVEALSYLRSLSDLRDLSRVEFFLDSNLVVNQLNGLFKVKDGKLRELLLKVRDLEQELSPAEVSYSYIPREQNRVADRLVNETLDRNLWG